MNLFLSYNSTDHSFVENIARRLRELEPFLDRWHLAPGMRWRSKLEDTLSSCKAIAIFVGPGEMGSWQQREVDVALDLQSRNPNLPVIPVLLPGCEPPLGFLRQLTWVDSFFIAPLPGLLVSGQKHGLITQGWARHGRGSYEKQPRSPHKSSQT
jgi:hypothetical protein